MQRDVASINGVNSIHHGVVGMKQNCHPACAAGACISSGQGLPQ